MLLLPILDRLVQQLLILLFLKEPQGLQDRLALQDQQAQPDLLALQVQIAP